MQVPPSSAPSAGPRKVPGAPEGPAGLSRFPRQNVALLEEEADINQLTEFFSYEHFYVIYCKFWELDTDHDLLIDAQDLARHNDHGERRPRAALRTCCLSGWRPAASRRLPAAPPPRPCGGGTRSRQGARAHGSLQQDTRETGRGHGPAADRRRASAHLFSGRLHAWPPRSVPGRPACPSCHIHGVC